jgi:DNA invertase Pin-like site-specific DNA recombinase
MNTKIRKHHLERKAIIYLRQSSLGQLEHNAESTKRQYDLKDRAIGMGWDNSRITILDADLGKSGTSIESRSDFQRLISTVGMGEAGAVFALEASRFSRSQADWHRLVDLCALTDTLIIDHDGVYDPNDFNDRVLLGFKGTWSHTELHGMNLRLQGAKINKAKRGELRCRPPIGYYYNDSSSLEMYPDEAVRSIVRMFFNYRFVLPILYAKARPWRSSRPTAV